MHATQPGPNLVRPPAGAKPLPRTRHRAKEAGATAPIPEAVARKAVSAI